MRHLVSCVVLGACLIVGCGRNIDVQQALEVADVSSGWYDAGVMEDGKNKLVPSIALRLKNVSDGPVSSVQINAIFRRVGDEDGWGEHFVRAIGQEGLEPGATGGDIVLRSNLGYTGDQARAQMLQNREFVDAMVNIFAKQGSQTWVKIGEYQIDRKLLTR